MRKNTIPKRYPADIVNRHEQYLNVLCADTMSLQAAVDNYGHMIEPKIIKAYYASNKIGSMLRRHAPKEFFVLFTWHNPTVKKVETSRPVRKGKRKRLVK